MGIQNQASQLKQLSDFIATDPDALSKLTDDATGVLAGFGIELDAATSEALAAQLGDRKALDASAQAAVVHIDL